MRPGGVNELGVVLAAHQVDAMVIEDLQAVIKATSVRLHAALELRGLRVWESIRSTGKTILVEVTGLKHLPDCATARIRCENASPDSGDLIDSLRDPTSFLLDRFRVRSVLDRLDLLFGTVVGIVCVDLVVIAQAAPGRIMPAGVCAGTRGSITG